MSLLLNASLWVPVLKPSSNSQTLETLNLYRAISNQTELGFYGVYTPHRGQKPGFRVWGWRRCRRRIHQLEEQQREGSQNAQ